jgi:hypothetical protein
MKKYDYIIGVDPDVDKSGIATLRTADRLIDCTTSSFPQVLEYFQFLKNVVSKESTVLVVIEASWLESNSNHHGVYGRAGQKIAKNVGSNHQTGKLLVEMARYYGLDVEEIRPLKKCWKGPNGKITHEELAYFIQTLPKKTNQEARDASLICWHYAGFPIRVTTLSNFKPQQK